MGRTRTDEFRKDAVRIALTSCGKNAVGNNATDRKSAASSDLETSFYGHQVNVYCH